MSVTFETGEIGLAASAAVKDLIGRAVTSAQIATYVEADPMPWSVISGGGWDLIGVPENEDGGGATLTDLTEVARVWGHACIPLPFIVSTMVKRWSPAARDSQEAVTLAVRRAGEPSRPAQVPFGALPGMSAAATLDGSSTGIVELTGAAVDRFAPSLRVATVDWASDVAPPAATELGVVWAAEATGSAEQVRDLSVAYAKERQQFGKPIGSFQSVKHRLSDMHVLVEAAETAVLWATVEQQDARRAALYALDASVRIAESAIQVHGGMGFTWEMGLHYYLRHILTLRALVYGLWS